MAENDLWDGISIMSPEEMENSVADQEVSTETKDTDEAGERAEEESFISEPKEKREEFDSDGSTSPSSDGTTSTEQEEEKQVQLNKYGALIKDLQEEGILSGVEGNELEEKLNNASKDTLKELMEETVNSKLSDKEKKWKNSFTGSKKRFLEIEDSFDNTDYAIQMAQRLDYLDGLDEQSISENPQLQKQLYAEDLRSKGYSEQDILEEIEDAEAIDKLENKAKKSLPYLRENANGVVEQSKKQKEARQQEMIKENEERYNSLMKDIDSRDEFIPGLKVNDKIKEKIKENITSPVHRDKDGREYTSLMYKQHKNPSEFQMLINYYDSLGLFNVDKEGGFNPDISKIKNIAKSKATSELDKVLEREEEQGLGRRDSSTGSQKSESILDLLDRGFKKGKR